MKKDIDFNPVMDVKVAIAKTTNEKGESDWYAYIINNKNVAIDNLLISSSAAEFEDGSGRKTSQLRHFIERLESESYAKIERVDPAVFGFYNRYWVSFYIGRQIFDKKFVVSPFQEWDVEELKELEMPAVEAQ
jgi:hypothetical protein